MGLHRRYAAILGEMPQTESLTFDAGEIGRRLKDLFSGMMRALFLQEGAAFKVEIVADPAVQEFVGAHASVLDSSFEKVEMSEAMRRRLSRSNFIFSGMKAFHELHEAFPSLLDENGNKKPFERFLNDVLSIDRTYNVNYLRAEYNFVSASAEMAAKWEQFMADGDRYNLQYRTQKDDKVRPEHAALHGVTLPPSDPFWEEFYPPNGWNCRCTVVQVRKSKYPVTPHSEAMRLGDEALQRDKKGMFRFNPGIEGKSIPDYNPYTISKCRTCPIAKDGKNGKFAALSLDNEECKACSIIRQMQGQESNRRLTKEERNRIKDAALSWADKNLPKVVMPNGALGTRLTTKTANGDIVHVGVTFFNETFSKNIRNRRLAETMQLTTKVKEWIGKAKFNRIEDGRHHNFQFKVYDVDFAGLHLEVKAKMTEGLILYLMRIL